MIMKKYQFRVFRPSKIWLSNPPWRKLPSHDLDSKIKIKLDFRFPNLDFSLILCCLYQEQLYGMVERPYWKWWIKLWPHGDLANMLIYEDLYRSIIGLLSRFISVRKVFLGWGRTVSWLFELQNTSSAIIYIHENNKFVGIIMKFDKASQNQFSKWDGMKAQKVAKRFYPNPEHFSARNEPR